MKYIVVYSIFLSTVFFLSCSMTTFRDYSYEKIKQEYEWGYFNAKMIGRDKKLKNGDSLRGEFYKLLLWISLKRDLSNPYKSAILDSVELFDEEDKIIVFEMKNVQKDFTLSSSNTFDSDFIFKPIPLKYHSYLLNVTFHFITEKNIERKQISLKTKFIKEYKEEKITFWKKLMGI